MTRPIRDTEVLIVGAGPTGLTLACLLARLGVAFVLVDKAEGPSTTSKAIGLQHRVSELLAWLGLSERFAARAAAASAEVSLYAEGRRIARLRLDSNVTRVGRDAFAPRLHIIPQSETEALLGERLGELGGAAEWGKALVGFTRGTRGVLAELRVASPSSSLPATESVAARYLVSCEGAHSLARKLVGVRFDGSTYPHDFIMADVQASAELPAAGSHTWLHPDGPVSAIALPGERRWRLFIEAGPARDQEVTLPLVAALFAARGGDRAVRFSDPTWLTRFKLHSRMVDRFRVGHVFLAGDAAHLHSPSGGQGITTGTQDAYNLGWKLAQVLRHGAPEALLDSYHEERAPAARAVLATTERNTALFFPRSRAGKWLRNHVVMPLLDRPWVQRRLTRKLSQLDAHYRPSSLSRQAGGAWTRGRRAGDRAPDVQLIRASDGGAGTLFAALAGGGWVAWLVTPRPSAPEAELVLALRRLGIDAHLVLPRAAAGRATAGLACGDGDLTLVDGHGDVARLYGGHRGLVLIRPDGYLGLVCRPARLPVVRAYLEQLWRTDAVARAFAAAPAVAALPLPA